MVKLATSARFSNLLARQSDFDQDPLLLNTASGVVDLRTGQIHPHSPEFKMMKITKAGVASPHEATRWHTFLMEIFGGDVELIQYVQRVVGYWLTGSTAERLFWILVGEGSNGKDVLLGTLEYILGAYAARVNPDLFIETRAQDPNSPKTEIARLKGLRLAIASEMPKGGKLNETGIKAMVSGDTLTARRLRQEPFTFQSTHKFAIATNHKPKVSTDLAVWDRMRILEFKKRFEGANKDIKLKDTLRKSSDAILGWMIVGARLNFLEGLGPEPKAVREATAAYRKREDVVSRWREERTRQHRDARESIGKLYDDFTAWAEAEGERLLTKADFGDSLEAAGFLPVKGAKGLRVRVGIELVSGTSAIEVA